MATIYNTSNGSGGSLSSDCTATRANVMENAKAVTSDSNDEAVFGTLPLTAVKVANGGTLQINSLTAFSVAQYASSPNTVIFTAAITAIPGKPWGGYYVRCKLGGYPTSITDGTECGYFSQSGATFTLPEATDAQVWYFRAWDFYRYNERGDTTYDSICWGASHDAYCTVKRYPTRYTLVYGGNTDQVVTGSIEVPAGFTHADVYLVGCGGWSGVSYFDITSYGTSGNETNGGCSGGEGGQVNVLSLSCSQGQTMSWSIGPVGTEPKGTLKEYSDVHWAWREPYSQGGVGASTYFYHNGNTYEALAGINGTSGGDTDWKSGGTGRPGADGGAANNTQQGTGGSGADGTYCPYTGVYYGGGGCGVGKSYQRWTSTADYDYLGVQGTKGATDGAYGHGGNAQVHHAQSATKGCAGCVVISFT